MAGLSLVEALLASLLLSIGMVLLLKGQAFMRDFGDQARERAAAAVLAEARLERLRAGLASVEPSGPDALLHTYGGWSSVHGEDPLDSEGSDRESSDRESSGRERSGRERSGRPEGMLRGSTSSVHARAPVGADGRAAPSAARPPRLETDHPPVSDETWHEVLDGSRYEFLQRVSAADSPFLQDVDLQLRWQDRSGIWQSLRWPARLGLGDPTVALLALHPQTVGNVALIRGRHPSISDAARTVSPGWLAFQAEASLAEAWLLDARTGWVMGLCELGGRSLDGLRAADIADCRSRMIGGGALLLSGEIHFDLSDRPSPSLPRSRAIPLGVVLRLSSAAASPAPPRCVSNASSALARGLAVVSYHCLVYPRGSDQRWSGRSELTGEAADLTRYRICRYSADHDRDGRIANPEHPPFYTDVDGPLTQQNFLVIRTGLPCPTDLPADPAAGRLLDMGTQAHQPPA